MKKPVLLSLFIMLLIFVTLNYIQAAFLSFPNKIFFTSYRDGNAEIYSMKSDGSSQTRLTDNAAYDGQPSCSADTYKFVFVSDRAGNKELYSMNSDGTSFHRITYHPASDLDPALSPDGTKIAFVSDWDGGYEIYTMAFNGTNLTRLTFTSVGERYPTWSPDGTKIAFSANNGIWVMNADGNNVRSLTNILGVASKPCWSPQGDRVAFIVEENGNSEIYVMNVDGSGLIQLINAPAFDQDPCWSPDGTKILFASDRSGNNELYIMNVTDGSGVVNLTNNGANDEEPCWGGLVSLTSPMPTVTPASTTPTPTQEPIFTPTPIAVEYWDSFGFGADDWITSAPSASIIATFSYGGKIYPALAAVEYGQGRAVYAEGSTFSELYNISIPGNVKHQMFVNSVKWVLRGKSPAQSKILATYGHRELLTYSNGANGIGSNAMEALRNCGYTVDVSFNIPSSLVGYDAVIMPGVGWHGTPAYSNPIYWSGSSGHAPTSNEVSTLLTFIENGGGLVSSVEYGTGASWMRPIGNPMGVSFAEISNTSGLIGHRISEHPIFLKY